MNSEVQGQTPSSLNESARIWLEADARTTCIWQFRVIAAEVAQSILAWCKENDEGVEQFVDRLDQMWFFVDEQIREAFLLFPDDAARRRILETVGCLTADEAAQRSKQWSSELWRHRNPQMAFIEGFPSPHFRGTDPENLVQVVDDYAGMPWVTSSTLEWALLDALIYGEASSFGVALKKNFLERRYGYLEFEREYERTRGKLSAIKERGSRRRLILFPGETTFASQAHLALLDRMHSTYDLLAGPVIAIRSLCTKLDRDLEAGFRWKSSAIALANAIEHREGATWSPSPSLSTFGPFSDLVGC